jgi:hypothetical protein
MEEVGPVEVRKSPSPVRSRDSSPKRSSDNSHPPDTPIGQSNDPKKTSRRHEELKAEGNFRAAMAELFMFGSGIFDKDKQPPSEDLDPMPEEVKAFQQAVKTAVETVFPKAPLEIKKEFRDVPFECRGWYEKFTWTTEHGTICLAVQPKSERLVIEWAEQAEQLVGPHWLDKHGPWSGLDISPTPLLYWDHQINAKNGDVEDETGSSDDPLSVVRRYLEGILAGTATSTNLNTTPGESLVPVPREVETWLYSIMTMVETLFPECPWEVIKEEETDHLGFLGWYNVHIANTKHGFISVYVWPHSEQVTIEWSKTKDRQSERTSCSLNISPTPGKYWDHVIEVQDGKITEKNGVSENPTLIVSAFLDAIAGDYPLHVRLPRT